MASVSCNGDGISGTEAACCGQATESGECCNNPVERQVPCYGCEQCVGPLESLREEAAEANAAIAREKSLELDDEEMPF